MAAITIPRGELGSAQVTSNVTTTSTSAVDLTGATVTVTTGTRPVVVSFYGMVSHSVASKQFQLNLVQDGSSIQQANAFSVTAGGFVPIHIMVRVNPAAGSHTFKVQWQVVDAGTGTVAGGGTFPAQLEVVEV